MTRRSDSDIDLEKYTPSREAMRQLCDPEAAEERIRRALADPELQAMLASEGRSAELTPMPPAPGSPIALGLQPRTSPPSPWAKEALAAQAVDAAALPSANAPAVVPAGRSAKKREAVAATAARPAERLTPTQKALAAIVLAFLPAMLVIVLDMRPRHPGAQSVTPPSAIAAPAPPPTGMPSATSTATGVMPPAASAEATAQPTAALTTSATVGPAIAPAKPKTKRRTPVDDPYEDASAQSAVKSAEPVPPPPPPKPEIIN